MWIVQSQTVVPPSKCVGFRLQKCMVYPTSCDVDLNFMAVYIQTGWGGFTNKHILWDTIGIGKLWFDGDLMVMLMGYYPLVSSNMAGWKIPELSGGF